MKVTTLLLLLCVHRPLPLLLVSPQAKTSGALTPTAENPTRTSTRSVFSLNMSLSRKNLKKASTRDLAPRFSSAPEDGRDLLWCWSEVSERRRSVPSEHLVLRPSHLWWLIVTSYRCLVSQYSPTLNIWYWYQPILTGTDICSCGINTLCLICIVISCMMP